MDMEPHDRLALQKLDVGSSTNEGVLGTETGEKGNASHAFLDQFHTSLPGVQIVFLSSNK